MAFLPPKKPRPAAPPPTPEEAEFLLWLASRQGRPSRDHRFPYYFPDSGRRGPFAPGAPVDAVEEPPAKAPGEPAAAPQPQPAGKMPAGWSPGYRGLLAQPEPRGLLDLPQQPELLPPSSAGLALAAAFAPQPQPPPTAPGGWTPLGYRGLLSGSRGLLDRPEGAEPPRLALSHMPERTEDSATEPPLTPAEVRFRAHWAAVQPMLGVPPASTPYPAPVPRLAQSGTPEQAGQSRAAAIIHSPARPVHDVYAGMPEYKRSFLQEHDQGQNWVDFIQATGYLPQVSAAEKMIYREIFAAEGGIVPHGRTVAGITKRILPDLVATGDLPESFATREPKDLTPRERAQVYRSYMNNAFQHVSGYRTLEEIENPALAASVADAVFREGGPEGTKLIHESLNAVLGEGTVPLDMTFRRRDVELLNGLTPRQAERLADYLAQVRAQKYFSTDSYEGEKSRGEHFRDLIKGQDY